MREPMARTKLIGGPMPPILREGPSRKSGSVIVTAQMRANAVRNCERYAWARQQRDALIAQVQPYMAMSDEELWQLLPSQEMPRDSDVNAGGAGCPNCGTEHFKAPYDPSRWHWDFVNHPWKIQCRNCNEWFPKNDFASYYASALDAHGKFRLGKGDKRFLAPEKPGDNPAWTEDGTGVRLGGNNWFFAAYHAFQRWWEVRRIIRQMAALYTLTNDPAYAHKAGVLLDRCADLYPEMDYEPFYRMGMESSTGGSGWGRVHGMIWECFLAEELSKAYDSIYEWVKQDEALAAFSKAMSDRYGTADKSSPRKIADHIENHLLKEFIVGVLDRSICGNLGMTEHAMATTAIALDHPEITPRYLDWLFEEKGGKAPYILQEVIGREGLSFESGLGYCMIPGKAFAAVAEMLRNYAPYTTHDFYRDYPKFRNCFTMAAAVRAGDCFFPNWGDANKTMNMGPLTLPPEMALAGYKVYGTKAIAREVWFAGDRSLDRLPLDVYDAEPTAVLERLKKDLADPEPPFASYNSGGYGCAFLQAPSRENQRCIMLYYGRMIYHGHEDRLALQMVARDVVAIPDLGYPLYTGAHPKRIGWTSHVISHNTVMVNDKGPRRDGSYSGKTRLFAESNPVRVADVDGEGSRIYDGVRTYRRCLVMVDVSKEDSYVLDLFWVRGGSNHRLIQNAGGPDVTHSGLSLTPQANGTYAGENVAFGEFYDGPKDWDYDGSGFMYLKNVEKGRPRGDFRVDWKLVEPRRDMPKDWEAHLRVHNLTPVDEAALCDGIPPEHKGNPERLRYLLRTRFGNDLRTQFVSVIEPYGKTPILRSVRALRNRIALSNAQAAVEITLADGRRDVLLVTENGGRVEAGGVTLDGRIGFVRFEGDRPVLARLIEGALLRTGEMEITLPAPSYAGKLVSFDESDPADVRLKLDTPVPADFAVGQYMIFNNRERSDASYRVEKVEDDGVVGIGSMSLVEAMRDPNDYSKGLRYTISPGEPYKLSRIGTWEAEESRQMPSSAR